MCGPLNLSPEMLPNAQFEVQKVRFIEQSLKFTIDSATFTSSRAELPALTAAAINKVGVDRLPTQWPIRSFYKVMPYLMEENGMNVGECWQFLETVLSGGAENDLSIAEWKSVDPSEELKTAVQFLGLPGISDLLEEWLNEIIFQNITKKIATQFWDFFHIVSKDAETNEQNFCAAFEYLHEIYEKRYLEAVRRLKWLQTLAASAPPVKSEDIPAAPPDATAKVIPQENPPRSSAFKSVKGKKDIFVAGDQPSIVTSVTSKSAVDFQNHGDNSEEKEENTHKKVVGFDLGHRQSPESLDGSYVTDKDVMANSLVSESGLSSQLPGNSAEFAQSESAVVTKPFCPMEEEDDDDESFIRSPIGGGKKSTPAPGPRILSGGAPSTPFPHCGSAGLRGLSSTSTPGMVLTATPGQLTPIIPTDSTPDLSTTRDETADTPSLRVDDSATERDQEKSYLPDASFVFGVPVAARPVPGQATNWPTKPEDLIQKIQVMLKSILFYTIPEKFTAIVKDFYSHAFEVYKAKHDQSDMEDEEKQDSRINFDLINAKMDEMGLMESISGSAITEIVHSQIDKHIEEECKGNFDTTFLTHLETWLDQLVIEWLKHIYTNKQTATQHASVIAFRDRLRHYIYETFGKSLIVQFFDIIIDFPDSKPAITDLSMCLEKAELRGELVSSLKNALESRLLHPGVNTAVILTAYINAIKSLRLLEPAGVILELVCEPVGRYLRSREDTVRCIVASLTDDGNNELVNELENTKPPCTAVEDADEEDGSLNPSWEDWNPDPVDADPSSGSRFRRSADILSTLVNIYGSKELFVNEYRALLADRILMQYNYDVERELRYLELLKLRFGEAQLHFCEVMLRDVAESRRVNARIQEAAKAAAGKGSEELEEPELEMNAMILSAQFWPAFRDEKIKLPAELQEHLDKYTRSFEQQKQNRTLVWKTHLGLMNIELELNGESLSFSVSPVQAAIIMKFQEKNQWTLEGLSQVLEMTPSVLRRKLAFWQGQGLLKESTQEGVVGDSHHVYTLVEERTGLRGGSHDMLGLVDIEEEAESAMASAQQQKEEEMQMLWTYIQGMLANLDCLTLERIHAMLRMFATEEPGSEVSVQELKAFLDNKVKDQILIFSSGVYRLNK
ncbi:anaphase-promoting complex subunit 2 [Elysia marginata]|uniref:Anaphase-promoting complex subunit 2 n=1 Tax=Elysia marginata TaxID=1093978 RepID=A0AAV4EAR5_9GAST|nr:anaphase-promoting complex subunit 2 [Elysia marginata]